MKLMLTISNNQKSILSTIVLENFFQRTADFLRDWARNDLADLSDAQLKDYVKDAYETANEHGVITEQGIVRWACLQVIAGAKFYDEPKVAGLFESNPDGDLLLEQIFEELSNREQSSKRPF
jgi:hypothetical protein